MKRSKARPLPADTAPKRWLWIVPVIALAAFAARGVAAKAWLSDDSFISLRYSENLLHGHGLVYNLGERVEGYTNFLWVMCLSGFGALGIPLETAANALGILSYAVLAGVLVGWWLSRRDEGPEFPVAAGLVLVLEDFHVWATGGLETTFFAVLALGGLLLACSRRPSPATDLAASTLLGLAVLTRPDGALFLLAGWTRPWWGRGASFPTRMQRTGFLLVPAAALIVGQVIFKLVYYGELLPTAFYSKSALRPYYAQGALYAGLWFLKNWAILPTAIAAIALGWRRGVDRARTDALFLASAGLLYLAYVIHSGGDFMFARRLIPSLPLLFLGLEYALAPRGRLATTRILMGVLLAGALLPVPLYDAHRGRISGIADEPRFYPPAVVQLRRDQGELLGGLLARTPARVMFEGGMCSFGYYSRLPYLIEITGLTQYSLAKLPLERRGWIGHEKWPTPRWLSDHGVNLIVTHDDPPFAPDSGGVEVDQVYFGWLARARIVRYSDAVMDSLRNKPGVLFVPIERTLGFAREAVLKGDLDNAREVYRYLDDFYFRSGGPKADAAAQEFQTLLRAKVAMRPPLPGAAP